MNGQTDMPPPNSLQAAATSSLASSPAVLLRIGKDSVDNPLLSQLLLLPAGIWSHYIVVLLRDIQDNYSREFYEEVEGIHSMCPVLHLIKRITPLPIEHSSQLCGWSKWCE